MKLSILLSMALVIFIGYQCLRVKKDECPYGAEWPDIDRLGLPPESERILVPVTTYRRGLNITDSDRPIPRLIVQTNEKSEIPQKMFDATTSLLILNPTYEYVYFTDQQAKAFVQKNFSQRVNNAYDRLIPGAYKADLFRYCFLWVRGGVYIDMGMIGLTKLDQVIKDADTFVAPEDNGTDSIYNAFMACEPHHPIIREAINLSVQNIENRDYTVNPLGITGPLLLSKAFENVMGEKVIPGKDYGDGIRIIKYTRYDKCESGLITDGGTRVLATRYPKYRIDQIWYNTKPHYSKLWKAKKVFR